MFKDEIAHKFCAYTTYFMLNRKYLTFYQTDVWMFSKNDLHKFNLLLFHECCCMMCKIQRYIAKYMNSPNTYNPTWSLISCCAECNRFTAALFVSVLPTFVLHEAIMLFPKSFYSLIIHNYYFSISLFLFSLLVFFPTRKNQILPKVYMWI